MADIQLTIIGAGVVGLAVAARLAEKMKGIYILEKNPKYGLETSSRNSEVIHAGIYYPHDSLKAKLCVRGNRLLYELCEKHQIPHQRITKIIAASSEEELPILERLYNHGLGNGVELQLLFKEEVAALEPNVRSCGGIFSPSTGIISAHGLMDYFYSRAKSFGVEFQMRCEVVGLEKRSNDFLITIKEDDEISSITSELVINAAGLHSDTIATMVGIDIDKHGYRIHFCKGSYFSVSSGKGKLISRLIYPVPHKEGLGIHALLDLTNRLKIGPDTEFLPENVIDYRVDESRRDYFAEKVGKLLPFIQRDDLMPDISGIRAKLQKKGRDFRDFVIANEKDKGLDGLINIVGIDSPGLTSAPAIAEYVEKFL